MSFVDQPRGDASPSPKLFHGDGDQQFRATFEQAPVGIAHVGLDGGWLRVNRRYCEILGYERDELLKLSFQQLTHPEDLAADLAQAGRLMAGEIDSYSLEKRYIRKDGTLIWVNLTGSAIRDESGNLLCLLAVAEEISARKSAEAALQSERSLLSGIIDNIPVLLCIWDPDLRTFRFNKHLRDVLGWTEADTRDGEFLARVYPDPDYRQQVIEHMRSLQRDWLDLKSTARDGSAIDISWANIALDSGVSLGIGIDIRQRKATEQTLRRATERYALLSETSAALLAASDPQAIIESLCRKVMTHLDCDVFFNFIANEDGGGLRLNACAGLDAQQRQGIEHLEFGLAVCGCVARDRQRIISEDIQHSGDPRTDCVKSYGVQAYCCHPLLAGARLIGTLSFGARRRAHFAPDEIELMRAVADQVAVAMERIRVENALRSAVESAEHAKKAAEAASLAKDHFLAILSHELRTPLNPALIAATILEKSPHLPPELQDDVSIIRRNVELEARLIDDMLDLTRIARGKLTLNRRVVDACEVLRHAIETCHADAADKSIALKLRLPKKPVEIDADPARLQQVFWNVLKNAIKFTPEHGRVTVSAAATTAGRLKVRVSDTGRGIDKEALNRIFDAFDQGEPKITRRYGGLGLGLAICKGLIAMHEGSIRAESAGPGKGAVFTIELPLFAASQHGAAPNSQTEQTSGSAFSGGGCRILLVEDHETTARITSRLLRSFGHHVTTAHCVKSAVEAFEHNFFDLLISDLGLPDGTGHELLQSLISKRPVKAIALSGFGMDNDLQKSTRAGFLEHLVKPINATQLEEAITRITGQAARPSPKDAPPHSLFFDGREKA